jgi:hypothetical protein
LARTAMLQLTDDGANAPGARVQHAVPCSSRGGSASSTQGGPCSSGRCAGHTPHHLVICRAQWGKNFSPKTMQRGLGFRTHRMLHQRAGHVRFGHTAEAKAQHPITFAQVPLKYIDMYACMELVTNYSCSTEHICLAVTYSCMLSPKQSATLTNSSTSSLGATTWPP